MTLVKLPLSTPCRLWCVSGIDGDLCRHSAVTVSHFNSRFTSGESESGTGSCFHIRESESGIGSFKMGIIDYDSREVALLNVQPIVVCHCCRRQSRHSTVTVSHFNLRFTSGECESGTGSCFHIRECESGTAVNLTAHWRMWIRNWFLFPYSRKWIWNWII